MQPVGGMQGYCASFVSFLSNNTLLLPYQVISLREFVKVDDKSVALALGDGPGERLAATIRKCCSDGRQLVVGNEELRDVIKSKLVSTCLFSSLSVSFRGWSLLTYQKHLFIFARKLIALTTRKLFMN